MQNLPGASGGQAALTMLAKAEQDCFRFVASLCREQMFAVICLSHKNKDTNCLQISRSHPRPLLLQERLCVLLAKAPPPPAPVLPGLRCKPWELIPFLVAAHPRGGTDLALCL